MTDTEILEWIAEHEVVCDAIFDGYTAKITWHDENDIPHQTIGMLMKTKLDALRNAVEKAKGANNGI